MSAQGNIVKEFLVGNTRIKICDDYCRELSPEAVQAVLSRIADRAEEQLTTTLSNRD